MPRNSKAFLSEKLKILDLLRKEQRVYAEVAKVYYKKRI
jgi:hypothetical protein